MKFIKSKKGLALLGVAAVVVAMSAIGAYAYFTNTGTGTQTNAAAVGTVPLTGSWAVTFPGTTSYTGGTALFPTAQGDPNQVTASRGWKITNTSEADELITTYTVEIDPSWNVAAGTVDSAHGLGCSAADFSINGLAPGTADVQTVGAAAPPLGTDPVLTTGEELGPNSDATTNSISGTATIQLIDTQKNQNDCQGAMPTLKVTASS